MLVVLHFVIDEARFKCCFFSTMKLRTAFWLGALFVVGGLNSCAPPPAGGHGGASMEAPARGDSSKSKLPWSQPVPEDRPGLATGWGKEKRSGMTYESFVRASASPAGTDLIFYNDSAGIEAMAKNKRKVGAMQRAAGEMVEWGVKGGSRFLETYKEYGYGRRLVAGNKGGNYSIVVKNRTKSALEIVASVDGLDVQDGKTASFSKRGYIVAPGKTLEIEGFRTSRNTVAAFKFSSVSGSYANLKHGNTRNVGVIGIAVFTQKGVNPWTWNADEVNQRNSANAFAEAP